MIKMIQKKYCKKCGVNFSLKNLDICSLCKKNHDFAVFLKNFISYLDGKSIFDDDVFIGMGIDEFEINEYIWKLSEFNLILFNKGRFSVKLDEINKFIDENYIDDFDDSNVIFEDSDLSDVYDSRTFVLNKEGKNYKVDILKIVRNIKFVEENPKVPFPQSDDLNRFIFLSQHLLKNDMSKNEIKQLNQVHERIVNMYTSTGLYFGVFEKYHKNKEIFYKLSDKGKSIFQLEEFDRNLRICQCILEHEIFHRIFLVCFFKKRINKNDIVEIMLQYDLNMDSMVTIKRRASCVSSWMHWIFRLMDIDI